MGARKHLTLENEELDAFEQLQAFLDEEKSWVFGYFSYDLKNSVENLSSNNQDCLNFPAMSFFRPDYLVRFNSTKVETLIENANYDYRDFLQEKSLEKISSDNPWKQAISKEEYLKKICHIKDHIQAGDVYEMNYCFQFYKENEEINPWAVFLELDKNTKAPFACYLEQDEFHLMSGTPERFLKKEGKKVTSQPIKGTVRRGKTKEEDQELIRSLQNDPKERRENIMITDLVRNDLSRTALRGTVKVEELCKIYTFETVHQMISTVTSEVDKKTSVTRIIKNAFPMGSMTGAPKVSAMELIEEYETTKRGIYSGAVGYFTPDKDFDFNVVIRSIAYNSKTKFVSAMVGGAIIDASVPEKEYDECLLKAKSLLDTLGN